MRLHKFLILFFILVSCSDDELILDNELDPQNPDYAPPETEILKNNTFPPIVEGVLVENSLLVTWEGNDDDMEFQYQLDFGTWSNWSSSTTTMLTYLDEGAHIFLVQSRYVSGTIEESPDTLEFTVDAVDGASLRIHQLYTNTTPNEDFSIDVYAEEVSAITGASMTINYGTEGMSLDTLIVGNFLSIYSQDIICFYSTVESAGLTTLQVDMATIGEDEYVSGTGILFTLHFTANNAGQWPIQFVPATFDEPLTTLRNANNVSLPINELINGVVNVE